MRIVYSPTFPDYWSLNVHVLRKRFRAIILIAAVLLGLFLIFPLMPNPAGEERGLMEIYIGCLGLLVLPGIVGFTFAMTYLATKKRWLSAWELREKREYDFDDAGIRVKSESMDSFTDWKIFTESVVTKKFVLLATAQQQFHYFTVAAVPDLPRLQELLEAKISGVKEA